uniref:Uncharacterized protein n=1 Tax=Glossina pallidipes TaxID=7398 RepID=A0A1B0AE67_GLOPL
MVKRNGQHAKQVHRPHRPENGEILLRRQYINSAIGQYAYGLDSFSFHLPEVFLWWMAVSSTLLVDLEEFLYQVLRHCLLSVESDTLLIYHTRIHLSFRLAVLMFLPNVESISDINCKYSRACFKTHRTPFLS